MIELNKISAYTPNFIFLKFFPTCFYDFESIIHAKFNVRKPIGLILLGFLTYDIFFLFNNPEYRREGSVFFDYKLPLKNENLITPNKIILNQGIQFNQSVEMILNTGKNMLDSVFYLGIIFTLKSNLKIFIVDPTQHQTSYYPFFIVNRQTGQLVLQISSSQSETLQYPTIKNDKKVFLLILFNKFRSYKNYAMTIGGVKNASNVLNVRNQLSTSNSNTIRIIPNDNIIDKIFLKSGSTDDGSILLIEEFLKNNGIHI